MKKDVFIPEMKGGKFGRHEMGKMSQKFNAAILRDVEGKNPEWDGINDCKICHKISPKRRGECEETEKIP